MSGGLELRPLLHGRYFIAVARALSSSVLALGSLVAVGWLFDIQPLCSIHPDWVPIKFNSALCFICIGAVLLSRTRQSRGRTERAAELALAIFVISIGILTLIQYAAGIDLGIDELLVRDTITAIPSHPGRMAFGGVINFILLGSSLLSYGFELRGRRLALYPALATWFIAFFSLIGFVHDAGSYLFFRYVLTSPHASFMFIFSSTAILLLLHHSGFMKKITRGSGAVLAARLFPVIFIMPFVFGWVERHLVGLGLFNHRIGTALFDGLYATAFALLIYFVVRVLYARDKERNGMLESLRISEERYRLITDNMTDTIWLMDPRLNYVFTSPSAARTLGYSPAELDRLPLEMLYTPSSHKRLMEAMNKLLSGERLMKEEPLFANHLDLEMIRKDGSVFWGEMKLDLVLDAGGKPSAILGVGRDVSDRVRAEEESRRKNLEIEAINEELTAALEEMEAANEELQVSNQMFEESEERYRLLVETAPDAIFVQIGGKFSYVNPAMEELMRASEEALLGTSVLERMHPDFHDAIRERIRMLNEERKPVPRLDQKYIRMDGTIVDVEVSAVPLTYKGEHGALVFVRNITERKHAEEALARERDRANLYFEIARVMLVALDAKANISLINRRGCKILGYKRDELIGKNWFETCLPEADKENVRVVFDKLMKGDTGLSEYAENLIVTKDGDLRKIAWHNTLLRDERGVITGTLSSGEDITERERAKERIIASLREKEVLLREIHHRVKNNMQVISSMLGLQSAHTADPGLAQVFAEVQQRIKSMAIIHEMLYKSESLAAIDMRGYINALCLFLFQTYTINTNRVSFLIDIEDISLELNIAVPLGLIANELISNSLKYAFPDGRGGSIKISMRCEDGVYAFSVRDDGVGLPEGLDPATGATLGLRLVDILVKQLDGNISIESNGGSAFNIIFGTEGRGKERHDEQ